MSAFWVVAFVVLAGTTAVYAPVALGSWMMRKRRLNAAWDAEPASLPPKRRNQYSRLLFQHAVKAHQSSDHEKAASTCQRVLRFEPDDPQASRLLVASLFAGGRFDEARQALERHLAANPHDEAAKLVPAAIFCEKGELRRARQELDSIDPKKLPQADRALWFNNYAFALSELQSDLDLAQEYGEQALMLATPPDRQFALRTLGVVHIARREPAKAVARLEEALGQKSHLRPGDVEFTKFHLGKALMDMGETSAAKNHLQGIVKGKTVYAEKARELLTEIP